MKEYRIVKELADFNEPWNFPEYYIKPYFFKLFGGWKRFVVWKGCDPLGFDYGNGDVMFKDLEDAKNFLKRQKYKRSVVYEK